MHVHEQKRAKQCFKKRNETVEELTDARVSIEEQTVEIQQLRETITNTLGFKHRFLIQSQLTPLHFYHKFLTGVRYSKNGVAGGRLESSKVRDSGM